MLNFIILFIEYLIDDNHIAMLAHTQVGSVKTVGMEVRILNENGLSLINSVILCYIILAMVVPVDSIFDEFQE